jgi:SAM-dependent methyltransferase
VQAPSALRRLVAGRLVPFNRDAIAARFLRGDGLEIGALHNPLPVPSGARVRYVDRMPVSELERQYPELRGKALVPVDVIDDGERLASVPDASVDFVIANHFLEHCQDPIGALGTMFRAVRPGGIVYLAIPDKRFTFDVDRDVNRQSTFSRITATVPQSRSATTSRNGRGSWTRSRRTKSTLTRPSFSRTNTASISTSGRRPSRSSC